MHHRDIAIGSTDFPRLGNKTEGKVRDVYVQPDRLLLVATDRHSSFDRIIAKIPGKGAILNLVSAFWFERTRDILPNHVIAVPDPNVTLATRCTPLPIEAVMRGYLTGVTSTSLWTHYAQGRRDFGDFVLPDAMRKNEALPEPVFTPSTKEATHDKTVDKKYLVDAGLIAPELLDEVEEASRRLFARGTEIARQAGLILVDTKYEFGLDADRRLVLIDEVHTPDSSRYWRSSTYSKLFAEAREPDNFDKELLRRYIAERCDPYKDPLPEIPDALIDEQYSRYAEIYRLLIGSAPPRNGDGALERIARNLAPYAAASGS
jgi:phosphoribosylaminoimidazole-succinocarboxamide synthase